MEFKGLERAPIWYVFLMSVVNAYILKNADARSELGSMEKTFWTYGSDLNLANSDDLGLCSRICSYFTIHNICFKHFVEMCYDPRPVPSPFPNFMASVWTPPWTKALPQELRNLLTRAKDLNATLTGPLPILCPFSRLFGLKLDPWLLVKMALPMIYLCMIKTFQLMLKLPSMLPKLQIDLGLMTQPELVMFETKYMETLMLISQNRNRNIHQLESEVMAQGIGSTNALGIGSTRMSPSLKCFIPVVGHYHILRSMLMTMSYVLVTGPKSSGKTELISMIGPQPVPIIECSEDYQNKYSLQNLLSVGAKCCIIVTSAADPETQWKPTVPYRIFANKADKFLEQISSFAECIEDPKIHLSAFILESNIPQDMISICDTGRWNSGQVLRVTDNKILLNRGVIAIVQELYQMVGLKLVPNPEQADRSYANLAHISFFK